MPSPVYGGNSVPVAETLDQAARAAQTGSTAGHGGVSLGPRPPAPVLAGGPADGERAGDRSALFPADHDADQCHVRQIGRSAAGGPQLRGAVKGRAQVQGAPTAELKLGVECESSEMQRFL